MTWQPIETAPKDGSRVLIWRGDTYSAEAVAGYWDDDKYARNPRPYWTGHDHYWRGKRWCREHAPTHWMTLPEPPVTP